MCHEPAGGGVAMPLATSPQLAGDLPWVHHHKRLGVSLAPAGLADDLFCELPRVVGHPAGVGRGLSFRVHLSISPTCPP
jgi:hypothetical protein